jgi:cell division protein FtsI (penicillin-binding protein 3)
MADDDPGRPVVAASTLKPIVVAAALDAGAIAETEKFDCGQGARNYDSPVYGKRTLSDLRPYGSLDAREILAVSSNIGMSRIFDALGGERLSRAFLRFHLDGAPAAIEDRSFEGAVVALGVRWRTTPLALAAAYAVLAGDGRYVAPGLDRGRRDAEPVISESAARAVRSMLVSAVSGERATGRLARIEGVTVAGKTGSEEDEPVANFAGIVPADAPRFVIVVSVVGAKKEGSGGTIAAPLFARVAKRLLASGR